MRAYLNHSQRPNATLPLLKIDDFLQNNNPEERGASPKRRAVKDSYFCANHSEDISAASMHFFFVCLSNSRFVVALLAIFLVAEVK